MRLVLRGGEDGEESSTVVCGIVCIGGEFGFYFHIVSFSVAVEDEFEQREATLVIKKVVVFIAYEFGVGVG